jgi:hypothetical protein
MRTHLLALATSAALVVAFGSFEASAQSSAYGAGWRDQQGDGYRGRAEMSKVRAMDVAAGTNAARNMDVVAASEARGVIARMTPVRDMDVGAETVTTQ